MTYYQTPTKHPKAGRIYTENKLSSQAQPHPTPAPRTKPTDWICMLCNNLNFSFRKKCNRCKTQTRLQNQNYFGGGTGTVGYGGDYCWDGGYGEGYDGAYLGVGKFVLGDITNCQTPQGKYQSMHAAEDINGFCLSDSQYRPTTSSPRRISIPIPVEYTSNILDSESWQNINAQPNDTNCERQSERQKDRQIEAYPEQIQQMKRNNREESHSICEFSDTEIQFLVNRVLGNQ